MAELECFFDCSSPWTYFAFESLLRMQDEIGVTIQWRPFLVGGVFNAVNPSVYNSRDTPVPAKAAYSKKDQQDWASLPRIADPVPPDRLPGEQRQGDARLHRAGA